MGSETRIQWADHTFNPWRGCSRVHAGCENCYAERMSARNPSVLGVWGDDGTRVVAAESHWKLPEKWGREAGERLRQWQSSAVGEYQRPRVFCASLADVFEDWRGTLVESHGDVLFACQCGNRDGLPESPPPWVPPKSVPCSDGCGRRMRWLTLNAVRRRLFDMIDRTPYLDWLLLTKRPANIWPMWPGGFRSNVWLYVSASDQETLDAMVPPLFEACDLSPVLGLSLEPLLGPVDLGAVLGGLNHVIVGGESGPGARPCRVEWIRSVVRQCRAAGVPVFVKQLGSHPVGSWNEAMMLVGEGERYMSHADSLVRWKLSDAKGGDPAEWPDDLRVREIPEGRSV